MKKFALVLSLVLCAGCVINFKSESDKKEGIIHVDLHYLYPGKSEMNTFERFYKKEVEKGHYAETRIELDPGQQLLILNKALTLHFFDWPENFSQVAGSGPAGSEQFLRIKADSLDHTIRWTGPLDDRLTPAVNSVKVLMEFIDSTVKSTESYLALPKGKSRL